MLDQSPTETGAGAIAHLKYLPCRHGDPSSTFSTHIKSGCGGMSLWYWCWSQRQEDPWNLLAYWPVRQPSQMGVPTHKERLNQKSRNGFRGMTHDVDLWLGYIHAYPHIHNSNNNRKPQQRKTQLLVKDSGLKPTSNSDTVWLVLGYLFFFL